MSKNIKDIFSFASAKIFSTPFCNGLQWMRRSLHATPLWDSWGKSPMGNRNMFLWLSFVFTANHSTSSITLWISFPLLLGSAKVLLYLLFIGTHFLHSVLKLYFVSAWVTHGHPHCQGPPAKASQNRSVRHIQCYIQAAGAKCDQMWTGCLPTRDGECNQYHKQFACDGCWWLSHVLLFVPATNRFMLHFKYTYSCTMLYPWASTTPLWSQCVMWQGAGFILSHILQKSAWRCR